jgi:hypothetical protein
VERTRAQASAAQALLVRARVYKRDKDGKFSSTGGGGSPEQLHEEAGIRATFDYHDEATGLTATVSSIRGGDPERSTYVDVTVTDRHGSVVGGGTRTIHAADSKSVAHSGFGLEPGIQGQGFMARYNAQVEQSYRDHGIERIEIHASGGNAGGTQMVGGYAWARAGYQFRGDSRYVVGRLASVVHGPRYSPEVRSEIERVAANPHSSPIDFAMIGHTPGAKMWPGKEIMLDMSWDGVKTL